MFTHGSLLAVAFAWRKGLSDAIYRLLRSREGRTAMKSRSDERLPNVSEKPSSGLLTPEVVDDYT
jgi:hypothetical protein